MQPVEPRDEVLEPRDEVLEPGDEVLEPGARVAAARDIDTTQGMHITEGAEGTVAEDRGSKLVVFFDEETSVTNLDNDDLRRLPERSTTQQALTMGWDPAGPDS